MKLFFFLIFFIKTARTSAMEQLNVELSGDVTLTFMFHPYYDSFRKSCLKLISSIKWIEIVNNNRYADDFYKGRIQTYEYTGRMDVRILNLQQVDAGIYRCKIHGTQNYIFQDFEVVLKYREPRIAPAWLSPKSTISTVTSQHTLSRKNQDSSSIISDSWDLRHTLGTVFGVAGIILAIAIVLGVICQKKKGRDPENGFSSAKHGRRLSSAPDIIPQPPQELNSIIYTTVDFKPHEEISEVYANLYLQNSGAISLDSDRILKTQESVEYSTICPV